MNILIFLCIIALGITVLRMVIGAAVVIVTGKAAGITKQVGPIM